MIKLLRGYNRPRPLRTHWRRLSRRWSLRQAPEISHHSVFLPGLHADFHGLRVVQLSDIHHSLYIPLQQVERAVEATNQLAPEMVVLTGDFITFSGNYVGPVARALGRLRAPLGVFAVLGNHDYRAGAEYVSRELRANGVHVLRNSHTALRRGEGKLWLAGVDDLWFSCDLARASRGIPGGAAKILLCHNPGIISQAAGHGFDLVLSGHTHGGQVRLPMLGSIYGTRRFRTGWDRLHDTQIYVSRGLGQVVVPFRVGCPPEIALFELRAR